MQCERSTKPKNTSATLQQQQESIYTVKVCNLPRNVSEKDLFEIFRKCGWIKSIKIICGNPLNYAYVNFVTLEGAKTACDKLQNSFVGESKIFLKLKIKENVKTSVTLFSFDSAKRNDKLAVVGKREIHQRHAKATPSITARKLGNNSTFRNEGTDTSVALDSDERDEQVTTIEVQLEKINHSVSLSNEFCLLQKDIQKDFNVTVVLPPKLLKKHCIKTSGRHPITVEILEGSIVYEQVDAIVNPTNEKLDHESGLAEELVKLGGNSIQLESTAYVKQHGQLFLSESICLGAGNLFCKHIIHVVGPRWKGGGNGEEESLYSGMYNVLISANKIQARTIALPAVGTGAFGVPEDVCASVIWKAIKHFCNNVQTSTLHTIRCVLKLPRVVKAFLSYGEDGKNLPSSDSSFPLYAWKWEEKSFNDYSPDVCKTLSKEYADNPKGSVKLHIGGKAYLVNFSDMTQTNISTLYKRKVQQIPIKSVNDNISKVYWLFKNDNNIFIPYTQTDSNTIEAMFQSKVSEVVTICRRKYSFDFKSMCQINIHTNTARSIQRREEYLKPLNLSLDDKIQVENTPLIVKLIGPQSKLSIAESLLKQKLKEMFKREKINICYNLISHILPKIKHICNENKVIYSCEKDSALDSTKRYY
ncbi:uncharacterized protein LOC143225833 [Tachypleus tridentatus]|uniref:uncharacterized protein LOC143225833 n=1 Tax=Tachypleus tridentatus TaxID=6853 RepID=UPI003FD09134